MTSAPPPGAAFRHLELQLDRWLEDLSRSGIFPGHVYVSPEDYRLLRHMEQRLTPDYKAVRWLGWRGVSDVYERAGLAVGEFAYDHARTGQPRKGRR